MKIILSKIRISWVSCRWLTLIWSLIMNFTEISSKINSKIKSSRFRRKKCGNPKWKWNGSISARIMTFHTGPWILRTNALSALSNIIAQIGSWIQAWLTGFTISSMIRTSSYASSVWNITAETVWSKIWMIYNWRQTPQWMNLILQACLYRRSFNIK